MYFYLRNLISLRYHTLFVTLLVLFFCFFNMCHIHSSNFSDRAAAGNNNSRRVPLLVGIVIVYNGVIGELLFSKEKLLKRCGGMCAGYVCRIGVHVRLIYVPVY